MESTPVSRIASTSCGGRTDEAQGTSSLTKRYRESIPASRASSAQGTSQGITTAAVKSMAQVVPRAALESAGEVRRSEQGQEKGRVGEVDQEAVVEKLEQAGDAITKATGATGATTAESAAKTEQIKAWAHAFENAAHLQSVTQKPIYSDTRPPHCLFELDDLYRVNQFIHGSVNAYLELSQPESYPGIQQWHELIHAADTDKTLNEQGRRQVVKYALSVMYQKGSPPAKLQAAANQLKHYVADLSLCSQYGPGQGWVNYGALMTIMQMQISTYPLWLRCAAADMVQQGALQYAIHIDGFGTPTEMIRPTYPIHNQVRFGTSPVIASWVESSLYSAVLRDLTGLQTLGQFVKFRNGNGRLSSDHERNYLQGMGELVMDNLSDKEFAKRSARLTAQYLNHFPRWRREEVKADIREWAMQHTLGAAMFGTPGNWFPMETLAKDVYEASLSHDFDLTLTVAILRREIGKGTIQFSTETIISPDRNEPPIVNVYLRSHKHRNERSPIQIEII